MDDRPKLPEGPSAPVIAAAAGPEGPPPTVVRYVDAYESPLVDDSGDGGLLDYWRILRRRKGTILIFACLGLLAGILFSLPQTPIYRAETTLEIKGLNENFFNLQDVTPTTNSSGYYAQEYEIATQVEILYSRAMLGRVVDKLKLGDRLEHRSEQRSSPEPGRVSAWRSALALPPPTTTSPREQALAMAGASLTVEPSRDTRIVKIYSDWPDAELAAEFANALTDEFIAEGLEARWEMTQRTAEWLSRQLEELRINLEKSEEKLQQYARATGLLFTDEKQSVAEEKLRQLQAELSRAQADRIVKQSRYELARTSPPETLPEILDHGPLREYQVKLSELRRQLAEVSSAYTPKHYRVKRVQAQIQQLESTLEAELSNITGRIANEYKAATHRQGLLDQDYRTQVRLVSQQAGKSIQYNILKREVDTNSQLYDDLMRKVKEAGVAAAMSATNIRVVDPATTPRFPYKPNHFLNGVLGLLSGAFFGIVFVFVRERADHTLKQPNETAEYLNVPELGVIPAATTDSMNGGKRKGGLSVRVVLRRGGNGKGTSILPRRKTRPRGPPADQVALVTSNQRPSLIAECFRATLTSILCTTQEKDRPRVLVVTSPSPHEGKTTVASNLAIALAEIDRRVLLIDADLRKPRLHEIFDLPNQWGLTSILRSQNGGGSGEKAIGLETRTPGLYLLPSGPRIPSISNLLYSPRAAELLRRARREFDTVLIDTPPMMQIADARVLARMADGVVLVVRAGHTTRDTAKAAAERFAEDGTRLLGSILNRWDPKLNGYGHYGRDYYDSYYSYQKEAE